MGDKFDTKVEIYSRVSGFFRPVQQWNRRKKEEHKERSEFVANDKEQKR